MCVGKSRGLSEEVTRWLGSIDGGMTSPYYYPCEGDKASSVAACESVWSGPCNSISVLLLSVEVYLESAEYTECGATMCTHLLGTCGASVDCTLYGSTDEFA